jgi:hypothetical protein
MFSNLCHFFTCADMQKIFMSLLQVKTLNNHNSSRTFVVHIRESEAQKKSEFIKIKDPWNSNKLFLSHIEHLMQGNNTDEDSKLNSQFLKNNSQKSVHNA